MSGSAGVTARHVAILEGVFEMERKPAVHTELRLAAQLELDEVAVRAWFRARRMTARRHRKNKVGVIIGITFFLICVAAIATSIALELRPAAKKRSHTGTGLI